MPATQEIPAQCQHGHRHVQEMPAQHPHRPILVRPVSFPRICASILVHFSGCLVERPFLRGHSGAVGPFLTSAAVARKTVTVLPPNLVPRVDWSGS